MDTKAYACVTGACCIVAIISAILYDLQIISSYKWAVGLVAMSAAFVSICVYLYQHYWKKQ